MRKSSNHRNFFAIIYVAVKEIIRKVVEMNHSENAMGDD